jgi:hypothetical protein
MVPDILQWISTILSLVGFVMYLLDKAKWHKFEKVSSMTLIVIAVSCAILSVFLAVIKKNIDTNGYSRKQEQAALTVIGDMSLKFNIINIEMIGLKQARDKWRDTQKKMASLKGDQLSRAREEYILYLKYRIKILDEIDLASKPGDSIINTLKSTDMSIRDIYVFYNTAYALIIKDIKSLYMTMLNQSDVMLDSDWYDKPFEIQYDIVRFSTYGMYYGFLELVAKMPEKGRKEYYSTFAPRLTEFPDTKMLSEEEAKSLGEKAFNKCDMLAGEYASIVGEENVKVEIKEKDVERIKKSRN